MEDREAKRLFPNGFWERTEKTDREKAIEEAQRLVASAANLRDLAARGMNTRRFRKAADQMETQAAKILGETK